MHAPAPPCHVTVLTYHACIRNGHAAAALAAESSITFDDVTVVINSCRVNVASFDPINNMPQLGPQVCSHKAARAQPAVATASQACSKRTRWTALQATGRRTGPGFEAALQPLSCKCLSGRFGSVMLFLRSVHTM